MEHFGFGWFYFLWALPGVFGWENRNGGWDFTVDVDALQYTQCITLAIAMLEPGCESITFEIGWSRQQCLSNLESQNQDENESQSRRSKD